MHPHPDRRRRLRLAVVSSLVAAYAALALYIDLGPRSTSVYVHLAYVPIVLAGLWCGRRGLWVAALQAALLLGLRLAGIGVGEPWTDAVRAAFFLLVGTVVSELSERLRREHRAAVAARENWHLLFESSLAGIWVYRDERIVACNPRLAEMLGRPRAEVEGLSLWDVIHPDDHPAVRELLALRASGAARDLHYECRLRRADGSPLWADQSSSPSVFEGRPAVLVSSYDVTRRREADRRQRELAELARQQEEQLVHSTRLAELGEMAAAVAHELNQPLSGIRTFAANAVYMIENDAGEPGEVADNLRRISEQVDRAARIIAQMRQLARRSERQFAPFALNPVLAECVDFLRAQLELAGIAVATSLDPQLPELHGDRLRLEQVFLNLLTNARQAMEAAPERRLTVTSRWEPHDPRPVVVEVADSGKGFPPDEARRLFTPFFTTKKPGQGTGLGLSISLNIVKDHDGIIEAAGAPGRGAVFTVRLPLAPPPPAEAGPARRGEP